MKIWRIFKLIAFSLILGLLVASIFTVLGVSYSSILFLFSSPLKLVSIFIVIIVGLTILNAFYQRLCRGTPNFIAGVRQVLLARKGDIRGNIYLSHLILSNRKLYLMLDPKGALKCIQDAANAGDSYSQHELAYLYHEGKHVAKNDEEALRLWILAAEQGFVASHTAMGNAYYHGWGTTINKAEAVKWYQKSAEKNDAVGQLWLGTLYKTGESVDRDNTIALQWFLKAAEQGNSQAQVEVGICYAEGIGVKKDEAEALKWWKKAALQGDMDAQYRLGYAHIKDRDIYEVIYWMKKAARQNYKEAHSVLGYIYLGEGAKSKGLKHLHAAAELGEEGAQEELGDYYNEGKWVRENKAVAVKFWQRAAEQGNEEAQRKLANMNS